MSFLDILTTDRDASAALNKLQEAGCDRGRLVELVMLAIFYRGKPGFVSSDGIKTLKRLPSRIKGWADEIERISVFARPDYRLITMLRDVPDEQRDHVVRVVERFEALPSDLRLYAQLLQAYLPEAGKFGRGFMANAGRQTLLDLVAYVRERTGRPRFAELSAILVAAAAALNVDAAPFATKQLKDRVEHSTEKRPRR